MQLKEQVTSLICKKVFSKNGAWLNATKGDMNASGKTLTVEGLFLGDGQVARKLATYNQDSSHKITARYTLTVDKIEVKSPGFLYFKWYC